jgi:hypothetical protein
MSGDPGQDRVEIVQRFGFGRGRPAQDDDFDSKRARRFDLGVGRAPAAVLGHQRFDSLIAHKRCFVGERERTARENQFAVGEGANLCRPVYRAHDVAMLRGSREGGELQSALRQEYCLRPNPKSRDGVLHGHHLDPAVAGLACPRRPAEDDERRIGRSAGGHGVRGHARSERMGRVDDGADALSGEKRRQAFDAAKAADASRDWRWSGVGGRARKRQDRRNIGLVSKPARKRAGFRRAAENEQAKAIQWAAP